ncbi:MAG TPA: PAS domain S-box protein, partial [Bryobacteraceae bacterium]
MTETGNDGAHSGRTGNSDELNVTWAGLAAAIDQADDAIVITDSSGRIEYVNPAFTSLTGYSREEALGNNPRFLKSGAQDRPYYEDLWQTITAGKVWHGGLINRRKDGRRYTEEMSITPVRGPDGAIRGYVAVKRDVSSGRLGRYAQGFLEALADSSEDAIFTHTLSGVVLTWNYGAEVTLGYRSEEMIGQFIGTLIPPEARDIIPESMRKLQQGEAISRVQTIALVKGGRRMDVSLSIYPIKEPSGGVTAAGVILRDITPRKQAEQSRLLLASIVDSSDDAIVGKNLDGTIVSWNKAAEHVYGYSAAEIVGRHLSVLAPPDRQVEADRILERIASGEVVSHFETVRLTKAGTRINVSLTVSPIRNGAGDIVGASAIGRDITQRKRAEAALHLTQSCVDEAPLSVTWLDRDGRVIYANNTAVHELGYSREELLSLRVADFNAAISGELWGEAWKQLKESGSIFLETEHRN